MQTDQIHKKRIQNVGQSKQARFCFRKYKFIQLTCRLQGKKIYLVFLGKSEKQTNLVCKPIEFVVIGPHEKIENGF